MSLFRRSSNIVNLTKYISTKRSHTVLYYSTKPTIANADTTVTRTGGQDDQQQSLIDRLKNTFNEDTQNKHVVPVFKKALLYGDKVAIKDLKDEFNYNDIFNASKQLSIQISNSCDSGSSSRIAFLCPNDVSYVTTQWACWFSGQIAVPLSAKHPIELLEYYIEDSGATLLITTPEMEKTMKILSTKLDIPLIVIDVYNNYYGGAEKTENSQTNLNTIPKDSIMEVNGKLIIDRAQSNEFYTNSDALILYTSGTTGPPKGVVISHKSLDAQLASLTNAWNVQPTDSFLHSLPLNHVHGIVNNLLLPLSTGSKCIMLPRYDNSLIWSYLLNVNMPIKDRVNVFMGVPTIYALLIQEYDKIFSENSRMREYIKTYCESKVRIMISGSAPLPQTVFNRWQEITGHKLLERYGMSECGMILSNPLIEDKVRQRIPGSVGQPLPNVEVKIIDNADAKGKTLLHMKGQPDKGFWSKNSTPSFENPSAKSEKIVGDLLVKGPSIFSKYWGREQATKECFTTDGWFKTGDTASYENGIITLLGRTSVDIIKTGGYKVSALEIETKLLEHPSIVDVAVVGLPDITWGQTIAAYIVWKHDSKIENNEEANIKSMNNWCEKKLAKYTIPTLYKFVPEISRNAMGKVNKKELIEIFMKEPVK